MGCRRVIIARRTARVTGNGSKYVFRLHYFIRILSLYSADDVTLAQRSSVDCLWVASLGTERWDGAKRRRSQIGTGSGGGADVMEVRLTKPKEANGNIEKKRNIEFRVGRRASSSKHEALTNKAASVPHR